MADIEYLTLSRMTLRLNSTYRTLAALVRMHNIPSVTFGNTSRQYYDVETMRQLLQQMRKVKI